MSILYIAKPCESMLSGSDVLGEKTCLYLKNLGVNVVILKLWSDWVGDLWNSKLPFRRKLCKCIIKYIFMPSHLKLIQPSDVVWVNGVGLPFDPTVIFEKEIKRIGARYIFHLQDNWFANEHQRLLAVRRVAMADLIVVPTLKLQNILMSMGCEAPVERLEEPINCDRFSQDQHALHSNNMIKLLWAGNPNNINELNDLDQIVQQIDNVSRVELVVICGYKRPMLNLQTHWTWIPYSPEAESEVSSQIDIALAPVKKTPYSECKGSYKVKTYMAAGIPVVASAVGHQAHLVEHGVTGYLANSDAEWIKYLTILIDDSILRTKMRSASRLRAKQMFSHDTVMNSWASCLLSYFKQIGH